MRQHVPHSRYPFSTGRFGPFLLMIVFIISDQMKTRPGRGAKEFIFFSFSPDYEDAFNHHFPSVQANRGRSENSGGSLPA